MTENGRLLQIFLWVTGILLLSSIIFFWGWVVGYEYANTIIWGVCDMMYENVRCT